MADVYFFCDLTDVAVDTARLDDRIRGSIGKTLCIYIILYIITMFFNIHNCIWFVCAYSIQKACAFYSVRTMLQCSSRTPMIHQTNMMNGVHP